MIHDPLFLQFIEHARKKERKMKEKKSLKALLNAKNAKWLNVIYSCYVHEATDGQTDRQKDGRTCLLLARVVFKKNLSA